MKEEGAYERRLVCEIWNLYIEWLIEDWFVK